MTGNDKPRPNRKDYMNIDISDLDHGDVLAALWNNAAPLPLLASPEDPAGPMDAHDGHFVWMRAVVSGAFPLGALCGRVLAVDLSGSSFDPVGYDEANGPGLARKVIDRMRATGSIGKI